MATNIITTGSTAENSDDFTLESGETASLVLKDAAGLVTTVFVDQKDDAGSYHQVGELQRGSQVLIGPGTFRVRRAAGGKACGIFRG